MLRPEPDAAPPRARHASRDLLQGGHERPGDAAVPLARRLRQGGAERELRARADGAVHARARATASATSARPPARSPASGSDWHDERPAALLLRRRGARRRGQDDLRHTRAASTGRTCSTSCVAPPRPRAVPRRQAVGLLRRARRLAGRHARAPGRRSTAAPGTEIKPVVGGDPRPPRALPEPRRARHGQVAGRVRRGRAARRAGQRHRPTDSWTWLLESMGQCPFHPPSVAGWDWGPAWLSSNSMRVRFDAANYLMDTPRRAREGRVHARRAVAAPGGRAGAPRRRATPGPRSRTDAELLRVARHLLTERKLKDGEWRQDAGARGHVPARAAPPAPLRPRRPGALMPRPPRLRRLPPDHRGLRRDLLGGAPLTRRQVLAGGARRRADALRGQGDADRAACSRPPPPTPRPRRTRPVLVSVFLPGGLDLLDTLRSAARLRPLRRPAPSS